MEQLTWPQGSTGPTFSSISTSDFGESDHRELPYPCQHANEASASGRHAKDAVNRRVSDHDGRHRLAPYNQTELALAPHGVDQVAWGPRRFGFKSQDERKAKNQNFYRFTQGRKEEVCNISRECHSEVNRSTASYVFSPHRPLRQESNISNATDTPGMACSSSTSLILGAHDFAVLPDDIMLRIMGCFSWKDLWSASMVCGSWCQSLAPLREAMHFVHWGKRFKHGRGGIQRNIDKALHSFLNGAKRGCTAAMVDVGLLLWEMGKKQEGLYWYKRAAHLGDPAGQCNLGLAFLQDARNAAEAVKWFQQAATAGHVRAQYSLALCLQQGRGIDCSIAKAARWYQRAADGGSARAMYNLALCYRKGEGLMVDSQSARKWMKRAALAGHRKAQFEHGLTLFAENDGGLALVFLELATRAGETAAIHLRDALVQQLSPKMRTQAINCADKWQAKLSART